MRLLLIKQYCNVQHTLLKLSRNLQKITLIYQPLFIPQICEISLILNDIISVYAGKFETA